MVAPYEPERLVVGGTHYELAANWKLLDRELPRVLPLPGDPSGAVRREPADSGDNYDGSRPGMWVGGMMDLEPHADTMSLDRRQRWA